MSMRAVRCLLITAFVMAGGAQSTAAASVHLDGHFTQHFGGRNGDGPICPDDELNCGTGLVAGYGRATDAFTDENDQFTYTVTLSDGSGLTMALDFVSRVLPGGSGSAPGDAQSYGNPFTLVFDAAVVSGTGQFAGTAGAGTVTLDIAGNVDQIDLSLDLELL